jgi:formylglycine-generating enzyme required for sulfatase activity
MSDLSGQTIGHYHILEKFDGDDIATTYKARDTRQKIDVAVKVFHLELIANDKSEKNIKRFEHEVRTLTKLNHPNILKVTDYGEYEGSLYLVTPLPSGRTLEQKLGQPIAWNEAATLLLPITRALAYAYQHGISHREIKPSNILVIEGGEPLLDVTKLLEVEETGIDTPEQRVDQRADVYALGMIFYEMVTGRKPYNTNSPKQTIDPLPRPRDFVQTLPQGVENILLKALAKNPTDRYADLASFTKEVEILLLDRLVTNYKGRGKIGAILQSQWKTIAVISGAIVIILALGSLPWRNRFEAAPTPAITAPPAIIASATNDSPTLTFTPALPTQTNTPVFTPTAKPLPEEITDSKGIKMRLVPAGKFTMGEDSAAHEVYLDDYYMDIYEVTNAAYKACVDDGGWCDLPSDRNWCRDEKSCLPSEISAHYKDPTYADHPVVYVNWSKANTYCEWRSARLPTEAEWEKAARGTDGRIYPWGNEPSCTKANTCKRDTTVVGSYEGGKSPYGIFDMIGNVNEWVSDWYSETYFQNSPSSNPPGPDSGDFKVVRGGSFDRYWWQRSNGQQIYQPVWSAARWWLNPVYKQDNVGFRCTSSAAP